MCRLFGFRSIIPSQVHSSLVGAENALEQQSNRHPDGWGVAYYMADAPHIIKSVSAAVNDQLFKRVSGVVSSLTVLAHLRKATIGSESIINTHPFQFGRWVFAHNGNIKDYEKHKKVLKSMVAPRLKRFILGDTDSELLFYLLLTKMGARIDLLRQNVGIDDVAKAVEELINELIPIIGPYQERDDADPSETFLTFIITNGTAMLAYQGGKSLYYSTYKSDCSERDTCPSFGQECISPSQNGYVNHLVFTSEPIDGENIWLPMSPGQIVGVDARMQLVNLNAPSGRKPAS